MTPERFIEDGDRVLALMTIEGRGKGSGVPVVIRSADLFTVRDGKIVSLVGYPDRAEALEAWGCGSRPPAAARGQAATIAHPPRQATAPQRPSHAPLPPRRPC
jgi:SnoaL-like domain